MTIIDTLLYRNRKLHLAKILMFIVFSKLFADTFYFLADIYVHPLFDIYGVPLTAFEECMEVFIFIFGFLFYIPGFLYTTFLYQLNKRSFFDCKSLVLYFLSLILSQYLFSPIPKHEGTPPLNKIQFILCLVYLIELFVLVSSINKKLPSHLKYIIS